MNGLHSLPEKYRPAKTVCQISFRPNTFSAEHLFDRGIIRANNCSAELLFGRKNFLYIQTEDHCGTFFDARDYDSLVWQGHVDGHVDDGLAGAC